MASFEYTFDQVADVDEDDKVDDVGEDDGVDDNFGEVRDDDVGEDEDGDDDADDNVSEVHDDDVSEDDDTGCEVEILGTWWLTQISNQQLRISTILGAIYIYIFQ